MSVTVEEIKNIGFLNLSLEEKIQINLWTPFEKSLDTPLILYLITVLIVLSIILLKNTWNLLTRICFLF